MNKKGIFNILIAVGIGAIILLLVFRSEPKPVFPISSVKTIEKRIAGKDTVINNYFTKIGNEKKIIDVISSQLEELRTELEQVKNRKDTFNIVRIQDTLIYTLTIENEHLRNVINYQDSVIVAQRYIINSKDTLIAIARNDGKKYKRQRNWSIAGNVVQGVILGGVLFLK